MIALLLLLGLILVTALAIHIWAATAFDRQVHSSIDQIRAAPSSGRAPAISSGMPLLVSQFAERSGATTSSPHTSIRLRQAAELRMAPVAAMSHGGVARVTLSFDENGDIGNTFTLNGFSMGSSLQVS